MVIKNTLAQKNTKIHHNIPSLTRPRSRRSVLRGPILRLPSETEYSSIHVASSRTYHTPDMVTGAISRSRLAVPRAAHPVPHRTGQSAYMYTLVSDERNEIDDLHRTYWYSILYKILDVCVPVTGACTCRCARLHAACHTSSHHATTRRSSYAGHEPTLNM